MEWKSGNWPIGRTNQIPTSQIVVELPSYVGTTRNRASPPLWLATTQTDALHSPPTEIILHLCVWWCRMLLWEHSQRLLMITHICNHTEHYNLYPAFYKLSRQCTDRKKKNIIARKMLNIVLFSCSDRVKVGKQGLQLGIGGHNPMLPPPCNQCFHYIILQVNFTAAKFLIYTTCIIMIIKFQYCSTIKYQTTFNLLHNIKCISPHLMFFRGP